MKRQFLIHPEGHPAREPVVLALLRYIETELRRDRAVEVTFDEPAFSRDAQGYWHGVVVKTIAQELFAGTAPAEVHEFLCGTRWGWKPSRTDGRSVPVRTTTTDESGRASKLRKQEFGDLIEWAVAWAAERGCYVPDPVKVWKG